MKMHVLAAAAVATLALAGCASTSPSYGTSDYNNYPPPASANCYDCGTVTRIDAVGGQQRTGTTGAVLGGVVGAVAGHEIADDSSKGRQNTATVKGTSYNVYVRMDNGNTVTLNQADVGGIREGGYVRVYNGRAWAR